jgi:hypothetical protein
MKPRDPTKHTLALALISEFVSPQFINTMFKPHASNAERIKTEADYTRIHKAQLKRERKAAQKKGTK